MRSLRRKASTRGVGKVARARVKRFPGQTCGPRIDRRGAKLSAGRGLSQNAPDYPGGFAAGAGWGLIRDIGATRYILQTEAPDGSFLLWKWGATLSDVFGRAGLSKPPGMPESPCDLHKEWLNELKRRKGLLGVVDPVRTSYQGVIARDGNVRLIMSPDGACFALQHKPPRQKEWRRLRSGLDRSALAPAVVGYFEQWPAVPAWAVKSDKLRDALHGLKHRPKTVAAKLLG